MAKNTSLEVGAAETALYVIRNGCSQRDQRRVRHGGMRRLHHCCGRKKRQRLSYGGAPTGRPVVMTVEGLGAQENLHPLQKAFLNHHGVQCGFCTPGLLMSAQALINETPHPTGAGGGSHIRKSLPVYGYQQIVDAIAGARKPVGRDRPLTQPAYARPETLDEALLFLKRHGADTRPLAGGTDVMVDLRSGKLEIPYLLDISRLRDLQGLPDR
jgi:xanthine dehydrogenase iron-sulfur cluster and FAD-binding subunit A